MGRLKKIYIKYQEIFRYILFGVLTTVVNITVFILFDTVFNIPYLIANAISIIVAILFAFFTNKKYVFRTESPTFKIVFKEFYLFVGLRLISGLFDMLSMWIFVDLMNLETNFSKILTQFIIVISNYIFSKLYIFK
ncbi:GtrA family protein [Gracilibacillus sp. S3-1-1]|uniref:GtrA family protein n=1 Tax=Gracilibacillus pellucidus TaxID=3095368 RepID=A0ACC6M737_9BACI|nr:GtrA family protein [Gracilibacillus sp. S3-1-1]MDX8046774.1 GtrA family protein [Gracilibacillus sp. S3-1-1]